MINQTLYFFFIENEYLKKHFPMGIYNYNKLEIMLMVPYP